MKNILVVIILFCSSFVGYSQTNYTAKFGLKFTNIPYLGFEYNKDKWGFEVAITTFNSNLSLINNDPNTFFPVDQYRRKFLRPSVAAKYYFPNGTRDFPGFGSYIGLVATAAFQVSIDETYFTDYEFRYGVDLQNRTTSTVGFGPTLGYKHYIRNGFGVDFGATGILNPVIIGLNHNISSSTYNFHFRLTYTFPKPDEMGFSGDVEQVELEEEIEEEVRDRSKSSRKKKSKRKKSRKKKKRR